MTHSQPASPDVLDQWRRGIRLKHIEHAKSAARYRQLGRMLGVPVVVLSAFVATAIFATLTEGAVPEGWKIVGGLLSGLAATLSALQTFLNYGALAEQHRTAELGFGALRRDLERSLDAGPLDASQRQTIMTEIGQRWSQIEDGAPTVPDRIHRQAVKQVGLP